MLDGAFLDKLDSIGRQVGHRGQKKHLPFGGIQLVLAGDFFQLPPVGASQGKAKYAFEAACWETTVRSQFVLSHVFRQADRAFLSMLDEVRQGTPPGGLSQASKDMLDGLSRNQLVDSSVDGIEPTRLYPTNRDVDRINEGNLVNLPGPVCTLHAIDSGEGKYVEALRTHCQAPTVLKLKVGAQVMLLKVLPSPSFPSFPSS